MTILQQHIDFPKATWLILLLQNMMFRMEMKMKMKMVNDSIGAWDQCLKYVFVVLGIT